MKTTNSIYIIVAILLNGLVSHAQPSPDHLFEDIREQIIYHEPVQRSIVLSSGVELEYAEQGPVNGTPIIFLHGITDSWHSFEQVFSHLPKGMHAFAISQRGHGDSDRPSTGYEPADFASDLADFIEIRNLGRVVVVGHSMGGMIAQEFALTHPSMVSGLVIAGSAANFRDKPGIEEFRQTVMRLQDPIGREFMDEFQKATLSKPIDAAFYDRLVSESAKVPARVFQSALTGVMREDYSRRLARLSLPTLILWGNLDVFCTAADQQVLNNVIAGSKLVIYESVGHAIHWEEPVRFAKDISRFVKDIEMSQQSRSRK